jgi:cyclase
MLCYRIIPCLDCDLAFPNGRVVKGIEFQKIRYAGIPWQLAENITLKEQMRSYFLT